MCSHTKTPWLVFLLLVAATGFLAVPFAPASPDQQLTAASSYYIVREGDCLWNISGRLYHDPTLWPYLWKGNSYITNPNLIFPGDPLYLRPSGQGDAPEPAGVALASEGPVAPTEEQVGGPAAASVLHVNRMMTDVALLASDGLATAGAVIAGPERRFLFTFGDKIYLQFRGDTDPSGTGPYQVLRAVRQVRHPETGEMIGTLYRIMGAVQVEEHVGDRLARARILGSQEPIEVGDLVREGELLPREVASKRAVREVSGMIVSALGKEQEIAQHQVCFIDRGIQDGVETGDEFWVFQSRGEVPGIEPGEKVRIPDEKAGVVVVLAAEQKASTVLVVASRSSLSVGDAVKARTE
ncbi:MAG: LysM domain-containing protein [bacterium]